MSIGSAITRLAPSPTGALHLGNARTFLINWLLARQNGWRIILRIEDLDGPRLKPAADRGLIDDLRWLGIDWDEGPVYQSPRIPLYRQAVDKLLAQGDAYPCICTRREIETAASAPHAEDGAAIYPGTCRGRFDTVAAARNASGREPAIRFKMPAEAFSYVDHFAGHRTWHNLAADLGDFVILKNDGTAAYQLAVVWDDAEAAVTDVVRGDDLLDSVPRQVLLYRALGLADMVPRYTHLPLIVGSDGKRLAKRHGDTRLSHYRANGVTPSQILQLLAIWCGIESSPPIQTAADLVGQFDLGRLPPKNIILNVQDQIILQPR
jgi:glutamyl-tRNA synthetase